MSILKVGSACRYLTESEGLTWRRRDWDVRNIVRALKGEPFNGFTEFTVAGVIRKFESANSNELATLVLESIGKGALAQTVQQAFTIVPIPNSNMAVGADGPFRIMELAGILSAACPPSQGVVPALRWVQGRTASHKSAGSRSPERYEPHLRYVQQVLGPVVLFDDVITSGSQMIAAARVLRANGVYVAFGVTVANVVKEQLEPIKWQIHELELDPKPFNLDDFLNTKV